MDLSSWSSNCHRRGHGCLESQLAFRVYNPDKPDRFGMKVFELCDSETSYCCNFEFYTGKKTCSAGGATFDLVDKLIARYINNGRPLIVDNYFTSPDLFMHLNDHKTLACVTMRLNRKNGPPKLKKTSALTNGTLNLLCFFDKKVNILTTTHDDSMMTTGKINPVTHEPITKLTAVAQYSKFIGAVNRSDQMIAYNAFKRRTLKWWKKAFLHMYMLAVLNAYIQHKIADPAAQGLTHRLFCRDLVMQLVAWTPILRVLRDVGETWLLRLTARHFPSLVKPKENAKKKHPQRDCKVCSALGKLKRSRCQCSQCEAGLCIINCFEIDHTRKDFKCCLKWQRTSSPNPVDQEIWILIIFRWANILSCGLMWAKSPF